MRAWRDSQCLYGRRCVSVAKVGTESSIRMLFYSPLCGDVRYIHFDRTDSSRMLLRHQKTWAVDGIWRMHAAKLA